MPQCKLCRRYADAGQLLCDACNSEDNALVTETKASENTTKTPRRTSSPSPSKTNMVEGRAVVFSIGRMPGQVQQLAATSGSTIKGVCKSYFGHALPAEGVILVNGVKVKPNYVIKDGDVILFVHNNFPEGTEYAKNIAKGRAKIVHGTVSKSMAKRINITVKVPEKPIFFSS